MPLQPFAQAIADAYGPLLRDMVRDTSRALFWDGTYGPPDGRPVYGPFDWYPPAAHGACGLHGCRCCAAWEELWDEHCC